MLIFLGSLLRYGVPHPDSPLFTWNSFLSSSFLIGFIEEIPYRGFMLPKFQQRFGFFRPVEPLGEAGADGSGVAAGRRHDHRLQLHAGREGAAEYARFFSPVVARQIAEDRSGQALAGKRREITVLFSDIRDFTTISEGLTPEDVVELLREYFNTMVPIVLKHGGTLDKYVGDAIMALFSAPLAQADHARRAVRAGMEMIAQLPVLSPTWQAKCGRPLRIGVGINTGEAVVGVMGADHRREYSAIGDTVNLASRLEGITKEFKTPLAISQTTADAVGTEFRLRELGEVHVKGRGEGVRVFTVESERPADAPEAPGAATEGGHG